MIRRYKRILSLFLLFGAAGAIIAFLFGRQPNAPFRESLEECDANSENCSKAMIKKWTDRWLGIVEINDAGEFHDVFSATEILSRIGRRARESNALIVTYVHGWNHNAKDNNGNFVAFEELLKDLAIKESARGENARRVVGLYVGWRGSSIGAPLLWLSTFWSRKAVAEDIGHSVVALFATLNEIWVEAGKRCRSGGVASDTRMLTIGHSFGGLIAARAALPMLIKGVAEARGKPSGFHGLGDLVVLINPAVEASAFLGLRSQMWEYPSTRTKHPKLVVITSDADWATKFAFPAGRLLTVWDRSLPEWDHWWLMLKSIGHVDRFKTHDLTAASAGASGKGVRKIAEMALLADRTSETDWLRPGYKFSDTPFWLVKTDNSIVKHHSDFSYALRTFTEVLFTEIVQDAAASRQSCPLSTVE